MKQMKVIKRYANRKLYDTERSCYVTLEEIAQMIKDGEDLQVVDNKSKDDLTAVTLAQIIVEEEKKVAKMPLKLLKSIIQSGNDAIGDFYEKRVADPVKSLRDDVERRVEGLVRRDKADGDSSELTETLKPEVKASVVREFVSSTTEAFEAWQKRIDDRVRDAIHKAGLGKGGADIDELKRRVEELEGRLEKALAAKPGP